MSESDAGSTANDAIAILGGTGDQGPGLALRFAKAGRGVVIGSRKTEKAEQVAREILEAVPGASVTGFENAEATRRARIVILSVPFEHTASTVKSLRPVLTEGIGDGATRTLGLWQGSCAEMVKALVPDGVLVVSAFQNISAHRLRDLDHAVECDVVVSGPKAAREAVMALCPLVPGLRAIDGGPLSNARIVEEITALLIGLNIRYKVPEGFGIRFTGLPER